MACPNEVLSDYFVKFRLSEWSFASLFLWEPDCEKWSSVSSICKYCIVLL